MSRFVCLILLFVATAAWSQTIRQEDGVDQNVNYAALTAFGPWDDRNYQLTQSDLGLLAPHEAQLDVPIPAWFRVKLRKLFPHWRWDTRFVYPRAIDQFFDLRYGGLIQDGQPLAQRNEAFGTTPAIGSEISMNQLAGASEVTIEVNPVFPQQLIGGSNGNGDQVMYASDDGGATWTVVNVLEGTCCDPTVGWSSNGRIAYAAALTDTLGVAFYRSDDFGRTWNKTNTLVSSGGDKEFLHVDLSPSSLFRDNVYLTWHEGTVMKFARSLDRGLTFEPTLSFDNEPLGIGSDITTGADGAIYYFYPAFQNQEIVVLKSTDGGASFTPASTVAPTIGSFIFPIPAMPKRQAWIYVSAASDISGGLFNGSIYAAWTDVNAPEQIAVAENHTSVTVAYSRDGGATWNFSSPHPAIDFADVDRFNQWLTVDDTGVVHIVFYDTRNADNRAGVDLFYSKSTDGAQTWSEPIRVSSQTSPVPTNGNEWGDYNGVTALYDRVSPVWTDNRNGPPDERNALSSDVENLDQPIGFYLDLVTPIEDLSRRTCAPNSSVPIRVRVNALGGFNSPVTLAVPNRPPLINTAFSSSIVTPPITVDLTMTATVGSVPGVYSFDVVASADGFPDQILPLLIEVQDGLPDAPMLTGPTAGGANSGVGTVIFEWDTAAQTDEYRFQVSQFPDFSTLVADVTTTDTQSAVDGLADGSPYFWRVASGNACGQGTFSAAQRFIATPKSVLLIDEDGDQPDALAFYAESLDRLGVTYTPYDYLAETVAPSLELMQDHELVLWFTGDGNFVPTNAETDTLATYLDGGGALFFDSQQYLAIAGGDGDDPVPPFARNYLAVDSFQNNSGNYTSLNGVAEGPFSDLVGLGLTYPFVDSSLLQDFADRINAGDGGQLALIGTNGNGAATVTDNTIFFAFPFPAIAANNTGSGDAVMTRALTHLGLCAETDLEVSVQVTQGPCATDANLVAQVSGGQAPYTYIWEPGALAATPNAEMTDVVLGGLTTVVVTVTDALGCSATAAVPISSDLIYQTANLPAWTELGVLTPCLDSNENGLIEILDLLSGLDLRISAEIDVNQP